MATPDWGAIESAYQAGVMSLRDIGAQYGVTEGAIRKRAAKFGWVRKKKTGTQKSTQVRKNGTQKNNVRTKQSPASSDDGEKYATEKINSPSNTKPIRGSRTDPPIKPFQPGNQAALKHGGYARRMLWTDAVTEDARALTLEDELFRLRAANLVAAESIGRWTTQLEDVEEPQARKVLMDNIGAADKAMMRNTVRIESLERTLATLAIDREMPLKVIADREYRAAATEKVSLEADRLRRDAGIDDGNGDRDLGDFYADVEQSNTGDETDTESGPPSVLDDEST